MSNFRFSATEWRVILIFSAALATGMADSQSIMPVSPEIDADFGFEHHQSMFLVAAYFVGAAIAAAIAGPASDIWGRRIFFLGGIGIAAVADLLCFFVKPFPFLVVLRFFDGMGIGTCSLTYLAFMGDFFPYKRRGLAMGLVSVGFFGGMTFGPLAAARIAEAFEWRAIFLTLSCISALIFALAIVGLPSLPIKKGVKGGLRGLLSEWGLFHRLQGPRLVLISFAALSASAFSFNFFVVYWLDSVYHFSPTQRSFLLICLGVGTLLASPAAGLLADRFGKIVVSYYSSWAIAIGLMLIPFMPLLPGSLGSGGAILVSAALVGVFFGIRTTPVLALVTQIVPQQKRGNFLALKSIWTYMGIASAILIGLVVYKYSAVMVPGAVKDILAGALSRHIEGGDSSDVLTSFIGFIGLGGIVGLASILTAVLLGRLTAIPGIEDDEEETTP